MRRQYTDAAGQPRTLSKVQREILLKASGGHLRSPDTLAARLLAERGVITVAEWHCPLDPRCVIGLTPLGKALAKA